MDSFQLLVCVVAFILIPYCDSSPNQMDSTENPTDLNNYDYDATNHEDRSLLSDADPDVLSDFQTWAESVEKAEGFIASRIPTSTPSKEELNDNKDQAIAAIGTRSGGGGLLCRKGQVCRNCFGLGKNNELVPADCPNYASGSRSMQIPANGMKILTILLLLVCTIYGKMAPFNSMN